MTTPPTTGSSLWQFIRSLFERPQIAEPQQQVRFPSRLPSDLPHLSFGAVIEMVWQNRATGVHHRDPQETATRHVTAVASELTSQMSVLDPESARHRLNAHLGGLGQVPSSPALILYAAVPTLTVDEETRRAAEEHRRHRAQLEHWRLLKDTVFADPAMACAWWLADHPERLQQLPDMGPAFDRLTAITTANDGRANDLLRIADVLERFLAGLEAVDRQRLIENAGYIMTKFGHPDLARELNGSQ